MPSFRIFPFPVLCRFLPLLIPLISAQLFIVFTLYGELSSWRFFVVCFYLILLFEGIPGDIVSNSRKFVEPDQYLAFNSLSIFWYHLQPPLISLKNCIVLASTYFLI
jgi:hypothetical protein